MQGMNEFHGEEGNVIGYTRTNLLCVRLLNRCMNIEMAPRFFARARLVKVRGMVRTSFSNVCLVMCVSMHHLLSIFDFLLIRFFLLLLTCIFFSPCCVCLCALDQVTPDSCESFQSWGSFVVVVVVGFGFGVGFGSGCW